MNSIQQLPVFAINLQSRTERRTHIEEVFADRDEFSLTVVRAEEHAIGAIGLWNTIQKLIAEVDDAGYDCIILCEDDHEFTGDYDPISLFEAIGEAAASDADILLGGPSWFSGALQVSDRLFWVDKFSGLQFTVIFRQFFQTILNAAFTDTDAADFKISDISTHKYFMHPSISTQREFGYSDATRNNNEQGRVDRLFKISRKCAKTLVDVNAFYRAKGYPRNTELSHYPIHTENPHYPRNTENLHYPCNSELSHYPCNTRQPDYPSNTGEPHYPRHTENPHYPCETRESRPTHCDPDEFANFSLPTYIIHRPDRSDRHEHIAAQFNNKPEFELRHIELDPHPNQALSLLATFKQIAAAAIRNQDDVILVCEDDHQFTPEYSRDSFFAAIIEAVAAGADLLSGGVGRIDQLVPVSEQFFWTSAIWHLQFLVLFKSIFPKILEEPIDDIVDGKDIFMQMTSHKMLLSHFVSVKRDFGDPSYNAQPNQRPIADQFAHSIGRIQNIRKKAFNYQPV